MIHLIPSRGDSLEREIRRKQTVELCGPGQESVGSSVSVLAHEAGKEGIWLYLHPCRPGSSDLGLSGNGRGIWGQSDAGLGQVCTRQHDEYKSTLSVLVPEWQASN